MKFYAVLLTLSLISPCFAKVGGAYMIRPAPVRRVPEVIRELNMENQYRAAPQACIRLLAESIQNQMGNATQSQDGTGFVNLQRLSSRILEELSTARENNLRQLFISTGMAARRARMGLPPLGQN